MIVKEFRGQLLIVRQADHGVQSGLFAEGWGNDEFRPFDRRDLVVEAATRHDNGWIAWDSNPELNPETGRPVQFFNIPRHQHVMLYRLGIRDAAIRDPYVGIQVSMHGAGLYNDRYGTWRLREQKFSEEERLLVDEFLAEQDRLQRMLAGISIEPGMDAVTSDPRVWTNYKLIQVWDRLSLQFLLWMAGDGEISPAPIDGSADVTLRCTGLGELHLALDPYPFRDDQAVFPVEARLVPDRPYKTAEDFFETYLRTPRTYLECRTGRA